MLLYQFEKVIVFCHNNRFLYPCLLKNLSISSITEP